MAITYLLGLLLGLAALLLLLMISTFSLLHFPGNYTPPPTAHECGTEGGLPLQQSGFIYVQSEEPL